MKVLSVKSPWAERIVIGDKIIENRNWRTQYRGKLYIHRSGKNGAIIGSVELVNVFTELEALQRVPEEVRDIFGKYCWLLRNAHILKNEIPAKGKLGIWEYVRSEA